jgi:uncharacterized protein
VQARTIAAHIGVRHMEVETKEGVVSEYIANNGQACFHCKNTLYSTMTAVVEKVKELEGT